MTAEVDDIEYLLHQLQSDDPRKRVNCLRSISVYPMADRRLLSACEALLDDRAMTVLSIPYTFGEVRWCAADAVVALREALGIGVVVTLVDVVTPCTTNQIGELSRAAGLETELGGIEGDVKTLETLAAMDAVPRRTITRTPVR